MRPIVAIAWMAFVALASLPSTSALAQVRLEGVVVDAETSTPLSSVHVSLVDSNIGAVTNSEGRFAISVRRLPAELLVRHIGYESETVQIDGAQTGEIIARLHPAVVELDEIIVSGETFAENLIRNVIERKRIWRAALKTYQAQGFSRIALERDGTIVHMAEASFDAYWDRERGHRAVVSNYSQTANWYDELALPHAAYVPNLYDDHVSILGLDFIGPTHTDALDRYTFRFGGRRMLNEHVVFDLFVSPRDDRFATFVGTISVLDSAFALVSVNLRPARHVVFPAPVDQWGVGYVQQFEPVGDGPWLPVDLQADGMVSIAVDARRRRDVVIHQRAQLSSYTLNTQLPESAFAHPEGVVHDAAAVLNDPNFIYGRVMMPMTSREAEALDRLRHEPLTLRAAFPPSDRGGRLSAFLDGTPGSTRLSWPTVLGYEFRFRYNRVDGFLSSIGNTFELSPRLQMEWRLGQATGLRRVRSHIRLRHALGSVGFAEFEHLKDTRPSLQRSRYSISGSSLQPLLGGEDYFDFFWVDGATVTAGVESNGLTLSASLTRKKHRSVERSISKTWPFRERFRPNPAIRDGTLTSVAVSAGWTASQPHTVIRRANARVEYAPGTLKGSDFDFTRYAFDADIRIPTFLHHRPTPATLDLRVAAGASREYLPRQRLFALDGSLDILDAVHVGRWGTFRSLHGRPIEGNHHLALFWKHDFTSWPFEWGILWPLAHRRMGITLFGGHGRIWIPAPAPDHASYSPALQDRIINEIGASITRIGGSPLRLDITKPLDRSGLSIGFGADF